MQGLTEELSRKIAALGLVATLFVVSIHVAYSPKLGSAGFWFYYLIGGEGLANVAVPYFFVVSGFMLARHVDVAGWWRKETVKRLRTLLIPYLLWNLIYWSVFYLPKIISGQIRLTFCGDGGIGKALGLLPFYSPIISHLWFVRSLMLLVLFSVLLVWMCRTKRIGLLALAVAMIFYFVAPSLYRHYDDWENWFAVKSFLQGIFYFTVGIYLCYHPVTIEHPKWMGGVAFIFGVVLFALRHMLPIIEFQVECAAIAFSLIGIWLLLPVLTFPKWLTACSFPIYCLHIFPSAIFVVLARHVFGLTSSDATTTSCGIYILGIWFVWTTSLGLVLMIRKYIPRFSKIAFGGR